MLSRFATLVLSSVAIQFPPRMAQIKTFAFIDLETTGLPCMENNKTKITEMSVVTVQSEHLVSGVFPRVQNKLNLCFNPQKLISSGSERITGLSNYALEHQAPFNNKTVQIINAYLDLCPKPICLVAHNGNKFDYPILRAAIHQTGETLLENIVCIDSLLTFRQLDAEDLSAEQNLTTEPEEPDAANSLGQPEPDTSHSLDRTDSANSLPLELQDGFDEMLCRIVDEYEKEADPVNTGIKRALAVQKINETTPKKPAMSVSCDEVDKALEQRIASVSVVGKSQVGIYYDKSSNAKKLKTMTSKKRLNFGVSYKLCDIYKRLTNQEVIGAHEAECDVRMLIMCASTLGERFVNWANENACSFTEIPMMVPGRKIGT